MDSKTKKKKKTIFPRIILLAVIAFCIGLPFMIKNTKENNSKASILTCKAEKGSIAVTVSGTGTLYSKDEIKLNLPEGVELVRYAVSNSEMVKEGQALAVVSRKSALLAMSKLQNTLELLEKQMNECRKDKMSVNIYANVNGKVKALYAAKGDDVSEVMSEHGALAVVEMKDGTLINVTGVDGTVKEVCVKEGHTVWSASTLLFRLEDTSSTGRFESLAQTHRSYEEIMDRLTDMYITGTINAPCAGTVSGIDEAEAGLLAKEAKTVHAAIAANDPDPSPEPQPLSIGHVIVSKVDKDGNIVEVIDVDTDGKLPNIAVINDKLMEKPAKVGMLLEILEDTSTGFTEYKIDNKNIDFSNLLRMLSGFDDLDLGNLFGKLGGGSSAAKTETEEETMFSLYGKEIMKVTPQEKASVSITVDELDILSISVGDTTQVTVDALPGRAYEGVVTEVNTSPSNDGGNSKYSAVITFDREDDMLDGMNASCLITIEKKDGLLLVPVEAVDENGRECCVYTGFDENSGKPFNPVKVTTGLSDGVNVEILSGLSEGETCWYEYDDTLELSSLFGPPNRTANR